MLRHQISNLHPVGWYWGVLPKVLSWMMGRYIEITKLGVFTYFCELTISIR
jgi:hypothetical protein